MTELREAAIEYARRGWPVLPLYTFRNGRCDCRHADCPSPAKHPLTELVRNGLSNASTDIDRVADWWERYPTANIGLRTGDAFDVLDIDVPGGEEALLLLCAEYGELPIGTWARTGSGGRHVLFRPTGATNKAGFADHIDWRGQRGYIVAPPSLHYSGNRYEWGIAPDGELLSAPEWLRLLVDPPRVERERGEYRALPAGSGDGTPYGVKALENELDQLARTPQGMRNHELNACSFTLFRLVAGGELNAQVVEDRLVSVATSIGLGTTEAVRTIASGKKAGLADPRSAPPSLRLLTGGLSAPTSGDGLVSQAGVVEVVPPRQLTVVWIKDVFAAPPAEPPVIIQGLLRRGEMCVIGAPRAVGKTMFGMNMATLLGRGEGLLGGQLRITRSARVLYSQGELDEWEAFRRWYRMAGNEGPPDNVAETFDRWRLRVVRRRTSSAGRSQNESWAESDEFIEAVLDGRVEETIAQQCIDVLIIDPWAVYYAGAENSNDEVEAALDKLRDLTLRYGLSVVIFHHIGKSSDAREPEDLWRGASRLADWASTRVTMLPHYTKEQAEKQNMSRQDARRFLDVFFLRRGEPTPDFSMVIDHKTGWWTTWNAPGRPVASQSQRASWETALECAKAGGQWTSYRQAAVSLGIGSHNTAAIRVDRAVLDGWLDEIETDTGKRIFVPSERFMTEPEPGSATREEWSISTGQSGGQVNPVTESDQAGYDPDEEF